MIGAEILKIVDHKFSLYDSYLNKTAIITPFICIFKNHIYKNLTIKIYYLLIHIDVPEFNQKSFSCCAEGIGNSAIIDNRSDDSYKGMRQLSELFILDLGIQNIVHAGRDMKLGESVEQGCNFVPENRAPSNCNPITFAQWSMFRSLDHEQDKCREFNG